MFGIIEGTDMEPVVPAPSVCSPPAPVPIRLSTAPVDNLPAPPLPNMRSEIKAEGGPTTYFFSFHVSEVPLLSGVYEQFTRVTKESKPPQCLNDMREIYTPTMALHWNMCFVAPNEDLYIHREMVDEEMTIPVSVGFLRGVNESRPLGRRLQIAGHPVRLIEHFTITPSEQMVNWLHGRPIGIAAPYMDLTINCANGWRVHNGKMELERWRGGRSLQLLSNTSNDNGVAGSAALDSLQAALIAALGGEDCTVEARGTFWYPKYGFREWHTNAFHRTGWRMYAIKCDEDGKSAFAFRNPETGAVHRVLDADGSFNLFRVPDQAEPPLWHTIYSLTNRWSYGVWLSDACAESLLVAAETARGLSPGALGRPPSHNPSKSRQTEVIVSG